MSEFACNGIQEKAGCFLKIKIGNSPKHDRATGRIAATGPFRRRKGKWQSVMPGRLGWECWREESLEVFFFFAGKLVVWQLEGGGRCC
jgi:hypothetical protein